MQERALSSLKIGEKGIVVGFTDQVLSLKLLEMGVLPGVELIISQLAPFGDPIAVKLADYLLALRKDEASTILVI